MFSMLAMSGEELRKRREAAGILSYELAAAMKRHSSRVSQIESLAVVTDDAASKYLDALGRCLVAKTSGAVA